MKNQYTVDWQLLKQWANESRFSGIRFVFFIVWNVLLIISLSLCVFSAVVAVYSYIPFFVILSAFCIYRADIWYLLVARSQYKRYVQIYGKKSWLRTITFEDDEIIILEEKVQNVYSYSDIIAITEKADKINLKLKGKLIIRIYKSKFVDCTWEECKVKILQNNPQIRDN